VKRAIASDLPAITAFLMARKPRAMFPLSNLARFGLDGRGDYAPSIWFAAESGEVTDALVVGQGGAVMPVMPNGDWAAAKAVLTGRAVSAVIGPTEEVRPLIDVLGIGKAVTTLDDDEPHFSLHLDQLVIPEGPGEIAPLATADPETMIAWRAAYCEESLGLDRDAATKDGRASYHRYIAAQSHRVLMDGDTPLATTGFNAALPDIVQVGGVYTPPAFRRCGHARRIVALHLAEARATGAKTAVLFSGSENAARAYRAIGFTQIGWWTLFLLREKVIVDG
jgi:GNAT superfamily N-acetyltransferase